jgi:hypothetical protein
VCVSRRLVAVEPARYAHGVHRSNSITDLRARLATFRVDGPPALDDLRTDLRDLLGTERLVAYGLDQTETEISALSFLHTSHAVPRVERERFSRFVAVHPARWGLYNPVSPEPSQRNRVLA